MQSTPTEMIRVHVPGGSHDHVADNFNISREGLTLWRETVIGSRQTVAVYAPGQFLRAERLAADTPPSNPDQPMVG